MSFWLKTTLSIVLAGAAYGQGARVQIDNQDVRVLAVTSPAHAKGRLHEHKVNRVMVYLDGGHETLTTADGKVQELRWRAGDALWSPAGPAHVNANVGGAPFRVIEIELKKPASGQVIAPGELDPVRVDPQRYRVEFENPQVRVLRARYGPGESGVMHEHTRNRVVAYLTDELMEVSSEAGPPQQGRAKAGEATWGGYAKHREKNLKNSAFEVVVVELKTR